MLTYILRVLTGFPEIILCAKLCYTVKGNPFDTLLFRCCSGLKKILDKALLTCNLQYFITIYSFCVLSSAFYSVLYNSVLAT